MRQRACLSSVSCSLTGNRPESPCHSCGGGMGIPFSGLGRGGDVDREGLEPSASQVTRVAMVRRWRPELLPRSAFPLFCSSVRIPQQSLEHCRTSGWPGLRRARLSHVTALATISAMELLPRHDPNGWTARVRTAPLQAERQGKACTPLGPMPQDRALKRRGCCSSPGGRAEVVGHASLCARHGISQDTVSAFIERQGQT